METQSICRWPKVTMPTCGCSRLLLFAPCWPLLGEASSAPGSPGCALHLHPPAPAFEELRWGRERVSLVASHVCGTQFVTNMK